MRGWVLVGPEGLEEMASIRAWVERGVEFVETLPLKGLRRRRHSKLTLDGRFT